MHLSSESTPPRSILSIHAWCCAMKSRACGFQRKHNFDCDSPSNPMQAMLGGGLYLENARQSRLCRFYNRVCGLRAVFVMLQGHGASASESCEADAEVKLPILMPIDGKQNSGEEL